VEEGVQEDGGGLQVTDTGGGERRRITGVEGWWIRYSLWGGGKFDGERSGRGSVIDKRAN